MKKKKKKKLLSNNFVISLLRLSIQGGSIKKGWQLKFFNCEVWLWDEKMRDDVIFCELNEQ